MISSVIPGSKIILLDGVMLLFAARESNAGGFELCSDVGISCACQASIGPLRISAQITPILQNRRGRELNSYETERVSVIHVLSLYSKAPYFSVIVLSLPSRSRRILSGVAKRLIWVLRVEFQEDP